jgi:hypothetical protein
MRYVFIADEFYQHGSHGGAETCNFELIKRLRNRGDTVIEILSFFASVDFILQNDCDAFIVGNFLGLPDGSKEALQTRCYFLYEHDHKYLTTRDPSVFPGGVAPDTHIQHRSFYKNAEKVVVQSTKHKEIMGLNLKLDNIFVGVNFWSDEHMENLIEYKGTNKTYDAAVMHHIYPQKNHEQAFKYCQHKGLTYIVIPHGTPHKDFCKKLSQAKSLVFFPKVFETLSRVSVEANILNCDIIGNSNISYIYEDWSNYRGQELVDFLKSKEEETINLFN